MPAGDAYRDELSAAQARIVDLERLLAEERARNHQTDAWAALVRERAHAAGAIHAAGRIWPRFFAALLFLASWLTAAGFFSEQELFFAGAAFLAPFVLGLAAQRIARTNEVAARKQLAMVDERIAAVEKAMQQDRGG